MREAPPANFGMERFPFPSLGMDGVFSRLPLRHQDYNATASNSAIGLVFSGVLWAEGFDMHKHWKPCQRQAHPGYSRHKE